jgi:hypothetical protein
MWVALGTVVGAIGLSFALAFVASWIGGDAAEVVSLVGMLVGMPAFLLLLPVLILAVVVDHVVSVPVSRISSPDHVWVDGTRIPLAWTPTGAASARAVLDGGSFKGKLGVGYDARELAAILAVSAVLGGGVAGGPGARYTLQVEGATVEAIPVADGERQP